MNRDELQAIYLDTDITEFALKPYQFISLAISSSKWYPLRGKCRRAYSIPNVNLKLNNLREIDRVANPRVQMVYQVAGRINAFILIINIIIIIVISFITS